MPQPDSALQGAKAASFIDPFPRRQGAASPVLQWKLSLSVMLVTPSIGHSGAGKVEEQSRI